MGLPRSTDYGTLSVEADAADSSRALRRTATSSRPMATVAWVRRFARLGSSSTAGRCAGGVPGFRTLDERVGAGSVGNSGVIPAARPSWLPIGGARLERREWARREWRNGLWRPRLRGPRRSGRNRWQGRLGRPGLRRPGREWIGETTGGCGAAAGHQPCLFGVEWSHVSVLLVAQMKRTSSCQNEVRLCRLEPDAGRVHPPQRGYCGASGNRWRTRRGFRPRAKPRRTGTWFPMAVPSGPRQSSFGR